MAVSERLPYVAHAAFIRDSLSRVVQPASLLAGLALLVLIRQRLNERYPAEHCACLLFIIAGVNLAAAANDLIALFLSLELISIPTYVLLYLSRPDRRALEATVKYFLLSVFSSAFLLYGMSFLMGAAGSTNFALIRQSLEEPTGMVSIGMLQVALVMVVAGIGFRIASVPFHFYAPDVFQGTTMPSAALLAVVPKIAGFVALLRLVWSVMYTDQLSTAFAPLEPYSVALFAGLAILTMTVGNVLALLQTDVRRLLAYSSVAQMGIMIGVAGVALAEPALRVPAAVAIAVYALQHGVTKAALFASVGVAERSSGAVRGAVLAGAALLGATLLLGLTFVLLTVWPRSVGVLVVALSGYLVWSVSTRFSAQPNDHRRRSSGGVNEPRRPGRGERGA
jgi:NADH-quinone oxidoreductase subunit N